MDAYQKGYKAAKLEDIELIKRKMNLSYEETMDYLEIPKAEQREYLQLLKTVIQETLGKAEELLVSYLQEKMRRDDCSLEDAMDSLKVPEKIRDVIRERSTS